MESTPRWDQLYEPEDAGQIMYYREDKKGQIIQEGINEAGALCSWIAAGTAHSNHAIPMIPFFIYYSMFGFQRVGDLIWAAGDMQSRGFLMGGTAGRTTLAGEGLQHQDGHSHLVSTTIPNCVAYDPAFSYELAIIIHDGLRRMYKQQERIFYYITVMNENYRHPQMPKDAEQGIVKGMYRLQKSRGKAQVRLLGSGAILLEVIAAANLLKQEFNITADVWSVTSYSELRREAADVQRWNLLHPNKKPKQSYIENCFKGIDAPIVAASDYVKMVAEQIRPFLTAPYYTLGTDGYGRSDNRQKLRQFFEVDRHYIVLSALTALHEKGTINSKQLSQAIEKYQIDPEKANPLTV